MGATVASCATLEGTVGLQRPVRGPAGCRQQQLRLVSRVGGASYQQLPSTPHSLPAQLHATHKGWGGGLKSWLSMAVPQHWLWRPTECSMRYIGAKTGWKWPAFAVSLARARLHCPLAAAAPGCRSTDPVQSCSILLPAGETAGRCFSAAGSLHNLPAFEFCFQNSASPDGITPSIH